jgi:hypothetical protein
LKLFTGSRTESMHAARRGERPGNIPRVELVAESAITGQNIVMLVVGGVVVGVVLA